MKLKCLECGCVAEEEKFIFNTNDYDDEGNYIETVSCYECPECGVMSEMDADDEDVKVVEIENGDII